MKLCDIKPEESSEKFDSDQWRIERNERLDRWFLGDVAAKQVALVLWDACEMWDDLIDGDKEVTASDADRVLVGIFVKLAMNPFWQQKRIFIEPIVIIAINAWMDANELAHSSEEKHRQLAFHIRNYSTELGMACAFLVGGWDHLREVSAEMRKFFTHESYSEWELRQ